jgi:hypothetical protein
LYNNKLAVNKPKLLKQIDLKAKILYMFISIWVILSVFDVGFNLVKSYSEGKHWLPLSDTQKRQEVYGNIYNPINFISKKTESKSSILIYSKDDKAYYLGRYYLYPRNITVVSDNTKIESTLRNTNFDYLALDGYVQDFDRFKPVASGSFWTIFKRL